jgi:hypothetical protein
MESTVQEIEGAPCAPQPLVDMESKNSAEKDGTKEGPRRPRNLGRAARRRKAKTRSIDIALQSLLNGGDGVQEEDELQEVPSDRSQSLPGVLQRRQENQIAFDKDEPLLVSQLGYMPGNAIGVVGRVQNLMELYPCLYELLAKVDSKRYAKNNITVGKGEDGNDFMATSSPTALKLYPLALRKIFKGGKSGRKFKSRKRGHNEISQKDHNEHDTKADTNLQQSTDGNGTQSKETKGIDTDSVVEPFPTMYWLTHPLLRTLISQIELGSTQNVIQVQETLASSTEHLSKMKKAHESYGKQRWNLLTDDDKKDVADRRWTDAVGSVRGVAGIRKYETVKCLHTHSAHYLAFLGQNTKLDESLSDETSGDLIEENLIGKWTLQAVERVVKKGFKDQGEK